MRGRGRKRRYYERSVSGPCPAGPSMPRARSSAAWCRSNACHRGLLRRGSLHRLLRVAGTAWTSSACGRCAGLGRRRCGRKGLASAIVSTHFARVPCQRRRGLPLAELVSRLNRSICAEETKHAIATTHLSKLDPRGTGWNRPRGHTWFLFVRRTTQAEGQCHAHRILPIVETSRRYGLPPGIAAALLYRWPHRGFSG